MARWKPFVGQRERPLVLTVLKDGTDPAECISMPLDLSREEMRDILVEVVQGLEQQITTEAMTSSTPVTSAWTDGDTASAAVTELTREPVEDDVPADMRGDGHVIGRGVPDGILKTAARQGQRRTPPARGKARGKS